MKPFSRKTRSMDTAPGIPFRLLAFMLPAPLVLVDAAWASIAFSINVLWLISALLDKTVTNGEYLAFVVSLILAIVMSDYQVEAWRAAVATGELHVEKDEGTFFARNAALIPWYARSALVIYKPSGTGYVMRFPAGRYQIDLGKKVFYEAS